VTYHMILRAYPPHVACKTQRAQILYNRSWERQGSSSACNNISISCPAGTRPVSARSTETHPYTHTSFV